MVGDTLLGKSIENQIASSFFRARFFLCEFIELTSAIESIQGNNTVQCVHTPACTACTANLAKYLGRGTYYRGFSLQMVIWDKRIAVTLSIFNFSTWFLAQIVKNPGGHLSRPFLVPGDNFFEKLWREQDLVGAHGSALVFFFNRDHQQVCMADLFSS